MCTCCVVLYYIVSFIVIQVYLEFYDNRYYTIKNHFFVPSCLSGKKE